MQFMKERVPVIANLILAVGMILSVAANGNYTALRIYFYWCIAFNLYHRASFMDELRNYEKDKIAHPDRPLPRGLVTKVR